MRAQNPPMRLFTALWPDPVMRAAIATHQQAWAWPPRAAVVKPERLYLTLHFLGEVPAQRLSELVEGLHAPFQPFTLELRHSEVWPNGVAVLQPERVPDALALLHAVMGQAVAGLGVAVEARPYRPHVTLARRARGARPAKAQLTWQVDAGYALVQSLPGAGGYNVLKRFGS
jgi:RNA 2',3'-cyclic 3'-phosphodiesterase